MRMASITREDIRLAARTDPYNQRVFLRSEDPNDDELTECSLALVRDMKLEHLIVKSTDGKKMANSEPVGSIKDLAPKKTTTERPETLMAIVGASKDGDERYTTTRSENLKEVLEDRAKDPFYTNTKVYVDKDGNLCYKSYDEQGFTL